MEKVFPFILGLVKKIPIDAISLVRTILSDVMLVGWAEPTPSTFYV